ncbi:universal stress protein [Zunongwangia sp. F363]|uniref:Universal stress protein n=1 Tax=Autumnicola tepida TaxID=3075595 RepID=A0ABU3C590_9FLAO|nr:universal stress protein [Zunongwangia sp. F363]MDT0641510.1 universal stress protein [Zunongwangia sp. F363]
MLGIKNIMVAVDFNESVGELLAYAESLAEKYGAKIWLVHVTEPDPDFVGFKPGPQYIRDFKAEELKEEHRSLQALRDAFLNKEIESEALLIQGSTVETVLKEAEKLKSDLMIVGTHKHSFLHNLLSESVSLKLLKNTSIPILTIPIDEE